MKTLEKIDEYINQLEKKNLYNIGSLNELGLDDSIKERLIEYKNVGGPGYDAFFRKMLKKWKIKSYKDLPKDKQEEFFDELDKKWNSKKEKGKDGKKE